MKTKDEVPESIDSKNDAHQIALELIKQLITLSSGVLALSATFIDKFKSDSPWILIILILSWFSLIISILAGIQTISIIVQSRLLNIIDWSKDVGQRYASISKYSFVLGVVLFAAFALISFILHPSQSTQQLTCVIECCKK